MSTPRGQKPPPERVGARANNDLWLRVHLGQADAARLREMQTEEETPVDTIRRLIRTAAMVQPILQALERRPTSTVPIAPDPPTEPDDLVQRQADAMIAWLKPDDD